MKAFQIMGGLFYLTTELMEFYHGVKQRDRKDSQIKDFLLSCLL